MSDKFFFFISVNENCSIIISLLYAANYIKQFNKIIIQFYPYLEKTLCFIKSAQNKFANLVNIYIL